MSKAQNPLTLARAIVSAHKRWIESPAGGTLKEGLVKALAREGRRNAAEAAQVIKSALGRCTASDVVVKSDSFTADCMESVQSEQVALFRHALRVLEPVVQVVTKEETLSALREALYDANFVQAQLDVKAMLEPVQVIAAA